MGGDLHNPLLEREPDIDEITDYKIFAREAIKENKKLWNLAAPAIFTSLAQYSLGAITQVFAGHLTTLELDAVSTENMVIAGLAFGIMLGMGSALETLCGQAFGAKRLDMLGIYMQRSWVILNSTCVLMLPIYIWATPILKFFGQNDEIAKLAGTFSLYMIPQLFAYGFNFPLQKFLQAQSKVWTMAWIAGIALAFHILCSWLLIVQFKWGLVGAAISLNLSWWINVLGQFAYIAIGYCLALGLVLVGVPLKHWVALLGFQLLQHLEFWYYMLLVVLAGRLKDAQVAVAAISICTNLNGWEIMVFFGFNAAISVRISNELGAGRPRAAKFAILVIVMFSIVLGVFFFALVLGLRKVYGVPFTNSEEVVHAVSDLAVVFALAVLLNSIQPVLTGVAVGAGWQKIVAYINLACYYIVGLPLGFFLGSVLNMNVVGIWTGMITGVGLQTLILILLTLLTNWEKEARLAGSRVKQWGGSLDQEPETNGKSIRNGDGV
ncbi:hypothetical protein Syun_005483 [Stephania yunnanensis]|uniref:Protein DETOXIFICATION n=1 Tax=Stephania yunnanensis TaxID=152371 RepID=A0AAP0L5A1_9MAGN